MGGKKAASEKTLIKTKFNRTRNDLPEKMRHKMIEILNQQLANAFDLNSQIKQAHWNIKGPNFIALHEFFDKAAKEIRGYVDEIAERAVQLGGLALGTARVAADLSELPEYPLDITKSSDHVQALSRALSTFGKSVRTAIETTSEAGDADTADLLTQVSRGSDKLLWMVEAHNEPG